MFLTIYNNLCYKGSQLKESWYNGYDIHRHHIIPKHSGGNEYFLKGYKKGFTFFS